MAKKISRKQLLKEPDEFLTHSTRLLNYISVHKREVIGAVALVLVLVLLVNAVQFWNRRNEEKAFALLHETLQRYEELLKDQSSREAYQAVQADFERLLSQYRRKTAARLGRVHFANMAFAADQHEKARTLYQQALADFEKQPFYRHLILSSLGHVQTAQEDYAAAISSFETLLTGASEPLKAQALFMLSRLYGLTGNAARQAETIQRLINEHAASHYADLVKAPPAPSAAEPDLEPKPAAGAEAAEGTHADN